MRNLIFLLIIISPFVLGADRQSEKGPKSELDESVEHYTKRVSGQSNPDMVPQWKKMEVLLAGYPGALAEQLDEADHNLLMGLKDEVLWQKAAQSVLGIVWEIQSACFVASKAGQLAEIQRMEAIAHRDQEQLYSSYMDIISQAGQEAIYSYIDREVTPNVIYEETDWTAVILAQPSKAIEAYETRLQEQCLRSLEWRAVVDFKTFSVGDNVGYQIIRRIK